MFAFRRLRQGLYELRFDDLRELSMTFLRYQEFYESPRFHDRPFTLAEFITWYSKTHGVDGHFSYASGDWKGFNIPAEVIAQVIAAGIPDPNQYDVLMQALAHMMAMQDDRAYLIGVQADVEGLDDHETTHAMHYLDERYAKRCNSLIINANYQLMKLMREVLFSKGYTEKTFYDEVQAYLTTGGTIFENDGAAEKLEPWQEDFLDLQKRLKAVHAEHYPVFIKDIKTSS